MLLLQLVGDRVALAVDRAHGEAAEQEARERAEAALARAQASEARMTERAARITMCIAATPMAIDGLTQLSTLRESTNTLRLVTGVLGGIAFALWALTAVERHVPSATESARSSS